jgi:DNA modification methylase
MTVEILHGDCTTILTDGQISAPIQLTFLDPPFNQAKAYAYHEDDMPNEEYWAWMQHICGLIFNLTSDGGTIYFMQREKNTEFVLRCLRESGWALQNLIIWKKLTSAVPSTVRYGKQYQVIAYATKGARPRTFHRLRITPPLPANYKYERKSGMFVTDIWDDIRELTAGYFAGDEAIRAENGERFHKQQAPIALLLRILLTSTQVGDLVLDPFAGTGTTLCVAQQLGRSGVGVDIDPANIACIEERLRFTRKVDRVTDYYNDYLYTENLAEIWGKPPTQQKDDNVFDLPLFRPSGEA